MSFMSRFRKDKDSDEDEFDAMLSDDENAGMFMTTGGGPAVAEPAGEMDVAESQEPDASLTTLQAPADEEPEAEVTSEAADEDPGSDDDPLALFRSMQVVTESSGLAAEIEDIPAEELLAELRELRSMLPPVAGAATE
jgi:hypothetical protein